MAALDDKTLQNLNQRLKEMDALLATDYQRAIDLGAAFTKGFSKEQISALLEELNKISRKDAAKLNIMLNLTDVNGRPITQQEAVRRVNQIKDAIEKGAASTSIRGTKIVGITAMTNELKRYKDALSVLGMSTSQQFDLIRRNVKSVKKEMENVGKTMNNMLPTLQRLASALGIAFSVRGLAQFGKKLVETRGEFERQQVALRSILQNKQLADEIWDKTMQAALQSPFTAMQLTTYTKQLAAYRIETEKLFDTTKRLADVSAGLGVDMGRLILAYGQVKAANYLRASEIRQFTEAGVNILGELSQYFTETREGMYDTARVMEMVTKRMVKFEDVEAIFKRMTDQGGIFYDMQRVQSQTVKGQIAKLHDAYDQMLNSIGKANEGVLKNFVSALNNIVKNWRSWAVVLKSFGWAAAIGFVSKFAFQLTGLQKASISTLRSIVMLKQGFKSLSTAFLANWPMLAAAAVAALVSSFVSLDKKMKQVNREIDEQNLRLYETRQNFQDMKSKIEANNDVLKDNKSSTDDLNKAQKENESIMQKLRNEYPQLAEQMSIATNGIIDMNDALDANIRKLNEQMTILNAMKQGSWFSDSDQKNLTDWQSALATFKTTLLSAQSSARTKMMQMELDGTTDKPIYDIYKKVSEIDLSGNILDAVDAFNLLNGELLAYQSNLYKGTPTIPESLYNVLGIKVGNLQANWSENRVGEVLDRLSPALQSYYENGIKDNADFLKEINEQYGGNVTAFIQANAEKINQATLDGLNNANSILINTLKPQTEEMKNFLNQELNKRFGTTGIDYFSKPTQDIKSTGSETPTTGKSTKESASRLISLIKEMRGEYDKLSKSAYGYAKSQDKVRQSYEDSVREILGEAGVGIDYDFTTNEGMIAALEKVKSFVQGSSKYAKDAWKDVQKYIDQLETEIEINAQVRIRDDFGKRMEQALNNYELTLELDKLNISPEAAKNLFPEFDSQTLGELQDAMQEFYQKQGASFDEEDLKVYKQWSDKIDAEILKSRKEKAKQYSKYLEKEYSERAKVEMQYAKDVAFVTANFKGEQQQNILKGIGDKYQQDISELTWKSFKESAFYVEMMDDLSSVPVDYMKIMLDKIEELLANPETLSPRALKEAINARQKILEAQMDFDQVAVMSESIGEIRSAARDVGGATWSETKKRLDEEQKAQAEKLKGLEEEIRCYEELQGQLKGLEEHDEAVAQANRALPEDVVSMLEGTDIDTLISQYSEELDSLSVSEDATTSAEKDENAQIQAKIEYLQRVIPLLEAYRNALDERAAYQNTDAGQNALFARQGGETSTSVGATITETKGEANKVSNRLSTLKKWQKAFTNFNNAFAKFNKNAADMVGRLGSLASAAFDLYDALGGETDAMTEAWKEFGGTIVNVITEALTMIPSLVAGFVTAGTTINAAMGIIGLIAEAIQLVLVLITGLSKLHDAGYEKEIENQQKIIDNLQRAYTRLEKEIEKTWDTASYIRTYNEETQNLYEQIEALNKQIAAEEAKKNTDKDKLQDYKDKIQDAEDELENLKQAQIEVFGGIGEEGYRDAAQGFVDAWKSAFLETGDGLQGLQDHFDEFLNEWFVKQATMRVAGKMLEPLFRDIDAAVDKYGQGGTSVMMSELEKVRERFSVIAPQLSEALEQLSSLWGLGGEGSLSGLAAGIQGMTEEQASILEAYWNSVRGYTASIDANVATIVGLLSEGGISGGVNYNPMLQQITLVAQNTNSISTLLQSVTRSGHGLGGSGIKVFVE